MNKPGREQAGPSNSVYYRTSRPQTKPRLTKHDAEQVGRSGSLPSQDSDQPALQQPVTLPVPSPIRPLENKCDGQEVVRILGQRESDDECPPRIGEPYRFSKASELLLRLTQADDIMEVLCSTSYTDLVWDGTVDEHARFEEAWIEAKNGSPSKMKELVSRLKAKL